jgi:hypothetical protein
VASSDDLDRSSSFRHHCCKSRKLFCSSPKFAAFHTNDFNWSTHPPMGYFRENIFKNGEMRLGRDMIGSIGERMNLMAWNLERASGFRDLIYFGQKMHFSSFSTFHFSKSNML